MNVTSYEISPEKQVFFLRNSPKILRRYLRLARVIFFRVVTLLFVYDKYFVLSNRSTRYPYYQLEDQFEMFLRKERSLAIKSSGTTIKDTGDRDWSIGERKARLEHRVRYIPGPRLRVRTHATIHTHTHLARFDYARFYVSGYREPSSSSCTGRPSDLFAGPSGERSRFYVNSTDISSSREYRRTERSRRRSAGEDEDHMEPEEPTRAFSWRLEGCSDAIRSSLEGSGQGSSSSFRSNRFFR